MHGLFSEFHYGKIFKKLNTFSFCSQINYWLLGLEVTIANREDPDQMASEEAI